MKLISQLHPSFPIAALTKRFGTKFNYCMFLSLTPAATQCQGSVHANLDGQASTAMRLAPQDFTASHASWCVSARMVLTATV